MRRKLLLLATAAGIAFGVGFAGPAAAGPPRDTDDVNCRPGTACHVEKTGWTDPPGRRNLGG